MTYLTMIRVGSQASCFLREPFFASLGEESQPEGEAGVSSGVDRRHAEFAAMGKAQGGGSGWVLLTWSPRNRELVNQWANMDYGARAAAYVDAFMAAINRPSVGRAYAGLRS
jgi:Fe-Mn family superoxide dismutase